MSLYEIKRAILAGELTSTEAVTDVLSRIEALDPTVGAFLSVDREKALAAAGEADRARRSGSGGHLGIMHGVPVALKDNMVAAGTVSSCGSKILEGWKSPYDATVTQLFKAAGAVIVGKTNMDEFAMGSSNENSAYKVCKNPWDLSRAPGGSSGGSAAAVSAMMVPGALGSDTGGSIRQPASFCGVVGLKPTYGRVSRYGLVAFASSLDQIGPFARDVRDCAILLETISGYDPRDSTSVPTPVPDFMSAIGRDVKGLKIGVPPEFFGAGCSGDVAAAVKKAASVLEGLGCTLVEVSLPHVDYGIAAYYILATAEASANLARFDGVRYGLRVKDGGDLSGMYGRTRAAGFGPEVKRRIMLGTYVLSSGYYDAYYLKAQKARTLISRDFSHAFSKADLILGPTSPTAAFKLGEMVDDPLAMYMADVYTVACNLAGLPGMSLPCGYTAGGLPIGLQLQGRPFDEETVLRAAYAYEQTALWDMRPPLARPGK
jgi:aspartyl-tRNA(Asn)/glutamyl-tRNA(Gln) amidotransferase subunit A